MGLGIYVSATSLQPSDNAKVLRQKAKVNSIHKRSQNVYKPFTND